MKTTPCRRLSEGVSRRSFLRGAGVTVGLPWLDSLARADATSPAEPPKRLAVLFMGNGVNEDHWSCTGDGSDMKFGKTLEVLEPIKSKVNVVHGLFQKRATGQGIHPAQTGCLLSGARIQKGTIIQAGITFDQVLAKRLGDATTHPSLVLACEHPMTGFHETNFSMAYSSHISWESPDSPVPTEVYPALAWDSLFENKGLLRNKSVLDRVMEDARGLTRRISAIDKAKLDEYLTSVREVEKRLEGMRAGMQKAADKAQGGSRPVAALERPANGLPEDVRDHARLMIDIIAIAFQTDRTRIASLLLCRDLSAMYYPFLDVQAGHHSASHDNKSEGYERITSFHLGQLTALAQKLDAMPEGEGSVLDNSLLMWVNNMWIGRSHDNSRLPLVLAGGLGGTIRTGRTLDYVGRPDEERRLCSLFLSVMDRMGVGLERFGDADERLAGI